MLATDMLGFSLDVITLRLNVDPTFCPMKQKKRNLIPIHSQVIEEDVTKLLEADFIHEIHYPEWLTNMVLFKKANRK